MSQIEIQDRDHAENLGLVAALIYTYHMTRIAMRFVLLFLLTWYLPALADGEHTYCMEWAGSESTLQGFMSACATCNSDTESASAVCNSGANSWCLSKGCSASGCNKQAACLRQIDVVPPGTTDPLPTDKDVTGTKVTPKTSPADPQKTQPARTQPANTTPKPGDQSACDQAAIAAANCCDHPETCGGAQPQGLVQAPGQGLNDYCKQMEAQAASNARANNAAGSACYQRIESCKTACNGAGDSASAQGCNSMISKVKALGTQGLASTGSTSNSDQCKNLSQAQPQSTGGSGGMPTMPNQNQNDQNKNTSNDPNDPTGCKNNPTGQQCQKCTANPNDPSCGTQMQKGTTTFSDNAEKPNDKSGFDIPDSPIPSRSLFDNGEMQAGQPMKNGTVANNTGGSVGGGGGGGAGASLGGGGKKPSPGSPGYSTDILQGNMPGGYTSPGGSGDTDGGGGWGGYGGRMPASDSGGKGMDLKQFLPGQKNAPAFVGGAYSMQSAEIGGKHGDIFEKVSRKFHEKCLLGQLIGCEN